MTEMRPRSNNPSLLRNESIASTPLLRSDVCGEDEFMMNAEGRGGGDDDGNTSSSSADGDADLTSFKR